ncbi:TetR family transcriptional regulator [Dubosiella newyorkensis]|nr:TetR family transcriptional regulator [Dubosiella newyorkensis]
MDTKEKIGYALLEKIKKKPLSKITIQEIAKEAQVSKQTFYNYFEDKEALIQYIYVHFIIPDFDETVFSVSFFQSYLRSLKQMKKYGSFMKQALMIEGQNSLRSYISTHCETFDLAYHRYLYGKELNETLRLSTIYHASASSAMTFSWILGEFQGKEEELAKLVCQMRRLGMDALCQKQDPYQVDD